MDRLLWQHKYKDTKDFLFGLLNKEFFVFLFFLSVSTAFWFLSTLNETYEKEIKVPIEVTDIPKDIVITDDLPDSIKVTLRDKGFNLLKYVFHDNIRPVRLQFILYAKTKNKGTVTPTEIQKIIKSRLDESTTIVTVKADHWDFYFCHGNRKKVPVLLNGNISAKANYYINHCALVPDSITVLAETEVLDTIYAVYTTPVNISNLTESTVRTISLTHIKGAKLEKNTATLNITADQLTEVQLKIPIRTVNVPAGVSLKTFPAQVDLRVAVGVRNSSSIKPEMFSVVADYNELPSEQDEKLRLKLVSQPRTAVKTYLIQPSVDYLLENN